MNNIFKTYRFWWLTLTALILTFFVAELFEKSMYIDGVWYATISRNLAEGQGSFWYPQFSETFFSSFHEHPPLLFGVESVFFRLLGDHWWTERLFTASLYLATATLIALYWRKIYHYRPALQWCFFLALIGWQFNRAGWYYHPANLLENLLIVFDLLAIGFLWKAAENRAPVRHTILAGACLFGAFLTKGFVGLFPLAFPAIYWLFFRSVSFSKMAGQTVLLAGVTALCFAGLFAIRPEALDSLSKYMDVQVLASLKGERRLYYYRDNRFYILGKLFYTLAPMMSLLFFNAFMSRFWKGQKVPWREIFQSREGRLAGVFFLTGMSASLPLMISPRQALPYLLPSLPFYSLALGVWTAFFLERWWPDFLEKQKRLARLAEVGALAAVLLSAGYCWSNFHHSNHRDAAVIHDSEVIGEVVGNNKIIGSNHYDMYISGYLMRYYGISLDTTHQANHDFLMVTKNQAPPEGAFSPVPLNTQLFDLYKKHTLAQRAEPGF
ncbi:MAG: hypothetical protein D6714_20470 [Bacteroidetes bacterium]|nr:MAG: hypothetical protein D6714_20470 [Bacteroidota bacterium]